MRTLLVVRKRASWNICGKRTTALEMLWNDGFTPKADIVSSCIRWVSVKQRTKLFASYLEKSDWSGTPDFTGNIISFSSVSDGVELLKTLHKERSGLAHLLICMSLDSAGLTVRTASYPPVPYFLCSKIFLLKIQLAWTSHVIKSQRDHN